MTAAPNLTDDRAVQDRRWWTLAVLCLSLLIVFVGNSSLNVTLPTLSRDLHATSSQLQWIVAAYALVFAGLLFTTGAIGDRFGRKGALQCGLVLFVVGASAASASTATWQLIASRAVMGAAAALIMPSTLSILINVFPSGERTKAIAIWASVAGAAGVVGPVASGALLGHFWYGSVFLINVPIVMVALVAGRFLVPKSKDAQQAKLDPVGAALSVLGIVALVFGLIEAPDRGWTSPATLGAFGMAAIVLTVFVLWETHTDEPMLDIRLFRNPAFSIGSGGVVLVFLAMYGVMFLLTQYLQLVLGYSALDSALRLSPIAPIMIVVAPLTPRLSGRFGAHKTVSSGMVLVAVGLLMLRALQLHSSYAYVLLCTVPLIAGIALTMSPMTASIMSAVPARRAGAGSAMNDATRELGSALGVAVLGSLAASRYSAGLSRLAAGLTPAARHTATSSLSGALRAASDLPSPAGRLLTTAAQAAFIDGIHLAVTVGAAFAVGAAILVLRYLPHVVAHDGALHGPIEAVEDVAQLGLAGLPPIFADQSVPQPGDVVTSLVVKSA